MFFWFALTSPASWKVGTALLQILHDLGHSDVLRLKPKSHYLAHVMLNLQKFQLSIPGVAPPGATKTL